MHANFHAGSADAECEFHCASCGHRRRARVIGLGEGASTFLNAEGTGERRAHEDAMKDLALTLAVVPCPACGVRNRTGIVRWWARNLIAPVALFGGLMAALTFAPTYLGLGIDPDEQRKLAWAMLGISLFVLLLMVPLPLWMKWGSTSARVQWL